MNFNRLRGFETLALAPSFLAIGAPAVEEFGVN
jgi:hypothetical protein